MLEKLPNEILHLVFGQFATAADLIHGEDDQKQKRYHLNQWKTLAQLCKVSRHLRSVAEPLLYQNYVKPDSASNLNAHSSFRKFLVTVLSRPELLQHIRRLHIGCWKHDFTQRLARPRKTCCRALICKKHYVPGLYGLLREHVKVSALSDAWETALYTGQETAEVALLISLTPNLEHIEFSMPHLALEKDTAPQYFWPTLLVATPDWSPADHFRRLESVMVHNRNILKKAEDSDEFGFEIEPFLLFIGLPSLEIFWVENDSPSIYRERPEIYPLNNEVSHLSEIILARTSIYPEKLLQILKRCDKLEACILGLRREGTDSFSGIPWDSFGQALRNSRHTLEELVLDADVDSSLVTEETARSIGSLHEFTSLKKLDTLQTTLLGFEDLIDDITLAVPALPFEEMLPSNLQRLTIDSCTLTLIPYLENLLAKLAQSFPHLQEIRTSEFDLREFLLYHYPEQEREAIKQSRRDRVKRLGEGFTRAGVDWLYDGLATFTINTSQG